MTLQEVVASIDMVLNIFQAMETEPVFFGSLIGAAVNGGLYRELGDIDVLADKKYQEKIKNHFKNVGFCNYVNKDIGKVGVLGCCPTEFLDGAHRFSFIFGNFKDDYFELPLKFGFSFRWSKKELTHKYEFEGRKFSGFSPEFYFMFLMIAEGKREKRKKDLMAVSKNINSARLIEIAKQNLIFWRGRPVPLLDKAQQSLSMWILSKQKQGGQAN